MNKRYGVPLKVQPSLLKGKNTAQQWTFKLNRAPATAETWHVNGHMLKVN